MRLQSNMDRGGGQTERASERLKYKIEHMGCNERWPDWSARVTERAHLKDRTGSIFQARMLDPVQSSLQALGNIIVCWFIEC
ncbi:unnamed protein product [Timema podura]|uniref:Uncharacterized protein n=1 Tax=Timema podura TaxID=61482 RepID=A0ABN7NCV1_TIMPD|nr:unnamed protein product [Timema podura]